MVSPWMVRGAVGAVVSVWFVPVRNNCVAVKSVSALLLVIEPRDTVAGNSDLGRQCDAVKNEASEN